MITLKKPRSNHGAIHVPELKGAAESLQAQYRSEKQRRKEMELRVNNLEEELLDLKTDKESLERVRMRHVSVGGAGKGSCFISFIHIIIPISA